jgi:predicted Zn finger-like uncharacterized protein
MLIECPRCAARYEVAEGLIGPAGKSVRCAKCGNVWLARAVTAAEGAPVQWPEPPQRAAAAPDLPPSGPPTAGPSAAEPPEDPALAELREAQAARGGDGGGSGKGFARFPAPPEAPPQAPPRTAGAAVLGWVATLAVLGAALWGAYAYREAVMEAWPPSQRVYLALGLRGGPPAP